MRRDRGFTLIEILVVCAVIGLVLIPIVGIFSDAIRQWNVQTGMAESMQEANSAANAMASEIAKGMQWSPQNILTLPGNADSNGNYTPVKSGLLGLGAVQYVGGTQVQYYISSPASSSGNLCRRYLNPGLFSSWTVDTNWGSLPGGTSSGAKYPNVTALSFNNGPPPQTVQISITIGTPLNGHVYSYTATRDVYLTNHN